MHRVKYIILASINTINKNLKCPVIFQCAYISLFVSTMIVLVVNTIIYLFVVYQSVTLLKGCMSCLYFSKKNISDQ